MAAILEIRDLHISYRTRAGILNPALAGVSFDLSPGEVLAVLGESGSGKSTLAMALLRLLPPNGCVTSGSVFFGETDLLRSTPEVLRQIRGRRVSMIHQEASLALHPTLRADQQVLRVLAAHGMANREALQEKALQVFSMVLPKDVERISRSYPHQLSGGQRQRVLIAQAIACNPSVIIADEPTALLDPTTQVEILEVFRTLREKFGLAMIFITHNPALLANFADRVLVLYAGRIIELGPAAAMLTSPRHPYTSGLLQSLPTSLEESGNRHKARLAAIAGDPWLPSSPHEGCSFEPRCAERMDVCRKREPLPVNVSSSQSVSCFKYEV